MILEDEPGVRLRLSRILAGLGLPDASIHGAADIAAAKLAFDTTSFALALIDIDLPDGSGIEFIDWLRQRDAKVIAVVVSTFGTQDLIVKALQVGAVGYLLKEREDVEIAASLRSIQRGGTPIDPFVAKYILGLVAAMPVSTIAVAATSEESALPDEYLTRREEEILNLVAQGLITREIAEKLSRSTLTIEGHVKNILRKLRVHTRAQAIYQARELGLL